MCASAGAPRDAPKRLFGLRWADDVNLEARTVRGWRRKERRKEKKPYYVAMSGRPGRGHRFDAHDRALRPPGPRELHEAVQRLHRSAEVAPGPEEPRRAVTAGAENPEASRDDGANGRYWDRTSGPRLVRAMLFR